MEKSNDILEMIRNNRAKIEALKNSIAAVKYSKRTDPEIVEAAEQAEALKIENAILYDNARRAYFAEVFPVVLEVFEKYAGKAYGPKTKDKINAEIKSRAHCAVYIDQNNYHSIINLIPLNAEGYSGTMYKYNSFEVYARYDFGTPVLTEDNKINLAALNIDNWRLSDCAEYMPDPAFSAGLIMKHFKQVKNACAAVQAACKEFNNNIPSSIDRLYEGNVANYIKFNF